MTTADRMTKEMLALDRTKGKRKDYRYNDLTRVGDLMNTAILIMVCLSIMIAVFIYGVCIAFYLLGIF